MSRRIQDPAQAAKAPESEQKQGKSPQGVQFVKNHLNEIITLPDGNTFQFVTTLQTITDPAIIKGLRDPEVSRRYSVFER